MGIDETVRDHMFEVAVVSKDALYDALREYGKKGAHEDYQEDWPKHHPTYGYCYVITRFVSTFAPPGAAPYELRIPGERQPHWYLKWPDGQVIDLTAEQFGDEYDNKVDYALGRKKKPFGKLSPSGRVGKAVKWLQDRLGRGEVNG